MTKDCITLVIDTSDSRETHIGIKRQGRLRTIWEKTGKFKSQNTLPLIKKILVQEKMTLAHIAAIEVNTGPGSFTGVRVGVAIANALAWTQNISVNGKKMALPTYAGSKFDS